MNGRSIHMYIAYEAAIETAVAATGASGHIGFLHAMDATNVWLLSGNSKNQVRISAYPRSKLIHNAPYRWPY